MGPWLESENPYRPQGRTHAGSTSKRIPLRHFDGALGAPGLENEIPYRPQGRIHAGSTRIHGVDPPPAERIHAPVEAKRTDPRLWATLNYIILINERERREREEGGRQGGESVHLPVSRILWGEGVFMVVVVVVVLRVVGVVGVVRIVGFVEKVSSSRSHPGVISECVGPYLGE